MLSLLQILLRLLQLIKGASTVKGAYGKAAGVEVGVYGYSFGVGFEAEAVKKPEFDAFKASKLDLVAETKAFDFEGFNVKAGAQYSVEKEAAAEKAKANRFAGALSLGYKNDDLKLNATVNTDLVYDIKAENFNADIAAKFVYDFLTVNGYYAKETRVYDPAVMVKNLLSFGVTTDLNSFKVPVTLTATATDLINKQNLGLKAKVVAGPVTVTPYVSYGIQDAKFGVGTGVEYIHESFTAKAGFGVALKEWKGDSTMLSASASISTDKLIDKATLALGWSGANDLLDNSNDADITNYGKLQASCTIAF